MTSAIKGTAYLSIATAIFMVSGYLINIWLGRVLGPADYGVYGIITSIIGFITVIQSSGITQAISKFTAEDHKSSESVLKTGLVVVSISATLFFIIFFTLADNISQLLNDKSLTQYIRLSAFIFIGYGLYGLYSDFYNGLHEFRKQAFINIIYSITKIIGIICLTYFFGLRGSLYGFIVATLTPLTFALHIPKKEVRFFPFKKLLLFALPVIGISLFSNLLLTLDIFLVKIMLVSQEKVGYYTATQNISRLLFYGMSSFYLTLLPSISHSVKNNPYEKTKILINKILRGILILLIPTSLLLSATSKTLLILIYSPEYSPADQSLAILIIGISFFTLFTVLNYILTGAGVPRTAFIISIISVIITIIAGFILTPLLGLSGAALATTIGSLVAMLLASLVLFRQFHTLISIKTLSKIFISSSIIYIISWFFPVPPIFLPFLYLILFSFYILLLILMREITWEDWVEIRQLIPSWIPLPR